MQNIITLAWEKNSPVRYHSLFRITCPSASIFLTHHKPADIHPEELSTIMKEENIRNNYHNIKNETFLPIGR